MSTPPELASILDEMGLAPADVPSIRAAWEYSRIRLEEARACLAEIGDPSVVSGAAFALGSLGRREASPGSDLDLAFVYDSRETTRNRAEQLRRDQIQALTDRFEVPEKTFRRAVDLEDLRHNVGGRRDSNDRLTYRALLLTEGAWLSSRDSATAIKRAVFDVYARGRVTRGHSLNSLANDLHRYYRTVCVDYRHKVEEQDKAWAVRSLKLRHSRKLWHLANLALEIWAADALADEAERDEALWERLAWPSLIRVAEAMRHFGALETCRPLFAAYDRFLAALEDPEARSALARLPYAERARSAAYVELRANAQQLDRGAQQVVEVLWDRRREHLVRFCLL